VNPVPLWVWVVYALGHIVPVAGLFVGTYLFVAILEMEQPIERQ